MPNFKAAKFNTGTGGGLKQTEDKIGFFNDALNPFSGIESNIPFHSTGARALVRIGGKPIGICTSIQWEIRYTAEPINTVDSPFPWDIDVGQVRIAASLSQFIDPTKGLEADAMAHIMPAAVHQPFVEMQVLDKIGTSIFFARGMFTSMTGNIARGTLSTFSANFMGVLFQSNSVQNFQPYSVGAKISSALNNLVTQASNLTGGIL
jgi:hypothetical protein